MSYESKLIIFGMLCGGMMEGGKGTWVAAAWLFIALGACVWLSFAEDDA